MRKLTKEDFVKKAYEKYGDRFDYSKSIYIDNKSKIEIVCKEHGSFHQRPDNHLTKKYGCNLCSPTNGAKINQKHFLEKCIKKHGDKFDYSKLIFNGVKKSVIIICKIHGEFQQRAENHYIYGCPDCAGNKRSDTDSFIKEASIVHNNFYDYSLVKYTSTFFKVKVICPKHGIFQQYPNNHLVGKGCISCSKGNTSKIERDWLDSLEIPKSRDHRNVKIFCDGYVFNVDGYYPPNIVYEFLGDFWHGNPSIYDGNQINKVSKKTFKQLFDKTVSRIRFLRKSGFKVISVWEKYFKKKKK